MAAAGQELTSPSGDALRFLQTSAETGGALLEVEATYVPGGSPPPEHYHPFQTEYFEVLSGTLETRIGGVTAIYGSGDRFEVPPGVVHTMHNSGDGVVRLRWQTKPALRTEEFFESVWGLSGERLGSVRRLLWLAVIVRTYHREFRLARPPYTVQVAALGLLAALGKLANRRSPKMPS